MASQDLITSCPCCKNEYESPRILPCLESLCTNCINDLSTNNQIRCYFCNENHKIPFEGFPLNKTLVKIIASLRESIKESVNDDLKNDLSKIHDLIEFMKCDLQGAKTKINEYCKNLKKKVEANIDYNVKLLNDRRDEMLDEIFLFEKECVKNLDSQKFEDLQKTLKEEESKIKERDRNKISRIKTSEFKLKGEKRKFKNLIFKNIDLIYCPIKLKQEPFLKRLNQKEINYNEYKKIDLNIQVSNRCNVIKLLDNGNFVIIHQEQCEQVLEIRSFLNSEQTCEPYSIEITSQSKLETFKNKIILFEKYLRLKKLIVFDENLNVIVEEHVDYNIKSILATESKILCKSDSGNKLIIYDWNLNEIMNVGNNSNIYYFNKKFEELFANEEYIFILESEAINIVSIEDGRLIKTISVGKGDEVLGVSSDFLFIDKMNEFEVLDFNGKWVDSIKKVNFPDDQNDLEYLVDKNGNLIFYNVFGSEVCFPSSYDFD